MTRTLMAAFMAVLALTACNAGSEPKEEHAREGEAHGQEEAEFERGPHQGRMLRDGDFAVELTIFEDGQEPQFRVYPYRKDKPLDPRQVALTVELTRLGAKWIASASRPRATSSPARASSRSRTPST